MKKLATVLLSILTIFCLFAFTACGEKEHTEDNSSNTKTTVTEEGWENAFAFFDNKENYKFSIKLTHGNPDVIQDFIAVHNLHVNYEQKIAYFNYFDSMSNKQEKYLWQDASGEVFQYVSCRGDNIGIDYGSNIEVKEILDSSFDAEIFEGVYYFPVIQVMVCREEYNRFSYDENTNAYTGHIENDYSTIEFNIFFEEGKIKKVRGKNIYNDVLIEYTYNQPSISIPQKILNMELGVFDIEPA